MEARARLPLGGHSGSWGCEEEAEGQAQHRVPGSLWGSGKGLGDTLSGTQSADSLAKPPPVGLKPASQMQNQGAGAVDLLARSTRGLPRPPGAS